jgi:hypothetical protein
VTPIIPTSSTPISLPDDNGLPPHLAAKMRNMRATDPALYATLPHREDTK